MTEVTSSSQPAPQTARPGPSHPDLLALDAADVTFEGTGDGVTTWVSDGIEELLGWTPEQVIGRPFAEFVADGQLEVVSALGHDVGLGRVGRVRLQLLGANHTRRWVDVIVKPMLDGGGVLVGSYGSWRDAEEEVEAAGHHQSIFAVMLDPLVTMRAVRDEGGRIVDFEYTDANPAACAYYQVSREELVGMRLLSLLPAYAAATQVEDCAAVVETGEPLVLDEYAYPRETFSGDERFYDIRAARLGDGLTYSWRDVTDRHVAVQRLYEGHAELQAALDSDIDPHLFLSANRDEAGQIMDFTITRANHAAMDYFLATRDHVIGERLSSLSSPEEFPDLLARYGAVVETRQPLVLDDAEAISGSTGRPGRFDLRAFQVGEGLSLTWRDVTDRLTAADRLVESQERLRATLDSMLDPHIVLEAVRDEVGTIVDFVFTDANEAAAAFNGLTREGLIGTRLLGQHPAAGTTSLFHDYVNAVETGKPIVRDDWTYPQDMLGGEVRRYDVRAVRFRDGLSQTWRDVTERHEVMRQLAESEERFRLLAENSGDVIVHVRDGRIAWISPSIEELTGRAPEGWIGREATETVVPADLPVCDETAAGVSRGERRRSRVRVEMPDGTEHWAEVHAQTFYDANGRPDGIIARTRIVDDIVLAETEVIHAAQHDALTGLVNRREVLHRIARLSDQQPRTGTQTALLFCDVDNFKAINDRHGHAVGDEVLRTIGERVSACIRAEDTAARIGGDEILIVLSGVHDLKGALAVAEKVRRATLPPIDASHGIEVSATMSIGVVLARPGESTDEMVNRADRAMYAAKAAGRDQIITAL